MRALLAILFFSLPLSAADLSVRVLSSSQTRPGTETGVNVFVDSDSIERSDIRVRIAFDPAFEVLAVQHWPFLWGCTSSPGEVICTNPEFKLGANGSITLTLRAPDEPRGGEHVITAEVTTAGDPNLENNVARGTLYVIPQLRVTNTNDSGDGSLRAAIEEANRLDCTPARRCDIRFVFPAGPLPVLEPLSPLPAIHACGVTIGDLPAAFDAKPPVQVELRGSRVAAGAGLELRGDCASDVRNIVGMAINGFPGDGIAINSGGGYRVWGCVISSNGGRGIAISGELAQTQIQDSQLRDNVRSGLVVWRGVATRILGTRISANGASGVFMAPEGGSLFVSDSTIENHPDFGVALHSRGVVNIGSADVKITGNRALDIDWNLDGPTPVGDRTRNIADTPRVLSARYDAQANVTHVTFSVSGPIPAGGGTLRLLLYSSSGLTRFGTAHLDTLLRAVSTTAASATLTETIPGDLRGRFLSAVAQTWSGQPFPDSPPPMMLNVSEVSGAVRVE